MVIAILNKREVKRIQNSFLVDLGGVQRAKPVFGLEFV